jgi:triosephosphate isomerase (TIM)
MMKKLIAGNWKMNGSVEAAESLAGQLSQGIDREPSLLGKCDFLVCPPFIHIAAVAGKITGASLLMGAQDCSALENGAYTGDVSASMLSDMGCKYVILGHSERRQYHKEKNEIIRAKVEAAIKNGLRVIVCIGETETQRDFGQAVKIVIEQLEGCIPNKGITADNLVIAYEPVWAIGTGKIPTVEDIAEIHLAIRDKLKEMLADGANMRILYGGSVKAENAAQLLNIQNVNGALIGGASLKADEFLSIARAVQ